MPSNDANKRRRQAAASVSGGWHDVPAKHRELVAAVVQAQVSGDLWIEIHGLLDSFQNVEKPLEPARVGPIWLEKILLCIIISPL